MKRHQTRKSMRLIRYFLYFTPAVLSCSAAMAQDECPAAISKLLESQQKKAFFALHICEVETGKTLAARNADEPLAPASNMKLVTTAAAVDLLGADFTYETLIGLYNKDLVVIGAGDPLTSDPDFTQQRGEDYDAIMQLVVEVLKTRGVKCIEGNLIVDAGIFDDERYHPSWPAEQADKRYAAQVAGLNFRGNCIGVHCTPGTKGEPPAVRLEPDTRYVSLRNEAKSRLSGGNIMGAGRLKNNELVLRGNCQTEFNFDVALDRPGAYFGFVLAEFLARQGIPVQGQLIVGALRDAQGAPPEGFDVLVRERTPLVNVLGRCNTDSFNLAAECLFKTLGAYGGESVDSGATSRTLRQGSWETGREVVSGFLRKRGIPAEAFKIDDGCGLSHENRLTPRSITTVLCYMARRPAAQMYRESLAQGDSGTLDRRNRFADPKYQDRIFVKTGYIARHRALSGYCQTADGRRLAFSILTRDGDSGTTKIIDAIVKTMMDEIK
ncbi:MAG: D-alanyl-D-alanine carboxypeptidase/D-alanyl-D-alanine-endopeptidase [Sedimentisphaerales bacterium]|nr:D-alanyl-D-alanine carboxypeptidase/D-alanyl-D-alanine-endopeptidase [Sedimentisphaerales bacterium]